MIKWKFERFVFDLLNTEVVLRLSLIWAQSNFLSWVHWGCIELNFKGIKIAVLSNKNKWNSTIQMWEEIENRKYYWWIKNDDWDLNLMNFLGMKMQCMCWCRCKNPMIIVSWCCQYWLYKLDVGGETYDICGMYWLQGRFDQHVRLM